MLLAIQRDLSRWHYPPYPGADRYVADLAGYLFPGPKQTLLGGTLGRAFDRNLTESTVFPGYLVLACSVAALASRTRRSAHSFWIVVGASAFVLSLGSTLHIAGRSFGLPLPFALVENLPLLSHLRAPSRFAILLMLALSLLLAATWTDWTARRAGARRLFLTSLASGWLALEFLAFPIPLFAAPLPDIYQ
ncbi:MAG: hypothetical protein L0Z53_24620, partial [Acidobacteriales bacterium]|nr:hypothetical protein [Terriglobales bacterium]